MGPDRENVGTDDMAAADGISAEGLVLAAGVPAAEV